MCEAGKWAKGHRGANSEEARGAGTISAGGTWSVFAGRLWPDRRFGGRAQNTPAPIFRECLRAKQYAILPLLSSVGWFCCDPSGAHLLGKYGRARREVVRVDDEISRFCSFSKAVRAVGGPECGRRPGATLLAGRGTRGGMNSVRYMCFCVHMATSSGHPAAGSFAFCLLGRRRRLE